MFVTTGLAVAGMVDRGGGVRRGRCQCSVVGHAHMAETRSDERQHQECHEPTASCPDVETPAPLSVC